MKRLFGETASSEIIKRMLKNNFNESTIVTIINDMKFKETDNSSNKSLINTLNNHIEKLKNDCLEIFSLYTDNNANNLGITKDQLKNDLINDIVQAIEKRLKLNQLIPGYKLVSEKTIQRERMSFGKKSGRKSGRKSKKSGRKSGRKSKKSGKKSAKKSAKKSRK